MQPFEGAADARLVRIQGFNNVLAVGIGFYCQYGQDPNSVRLVLNRSLYSLVAWG